MNAWGIERKRRDWIPVGRSVGWSGPLFFLVWYSLWILGTAAGWVAGQIAAPPIVSYVMFFSKIGGISSKYSSFTVFTLRTCSCGWTDGRTDGLLLVTCSVDSYYPFSLLSSSLYIHTSPIYPAHPTNQSSSTSSVIDNHIIQYPYPFHPKIPTSKEN